MIDARWVAVSTVLDPETDNVVHSNISDLSGMKKYFSAFPPRGGQAPWGLLNRNILISPDWADQLNLPVGRVPGSGDTWINDTTAVPAYLQQFLESYPMNGTDEIFSGFYPPHYNLSQLSDMHDQIADTIATVLSFVIADGLSRVSYMSDVGVVLHDNGNGTVSYLELYLQAGSSQAEPENMLLSTVDVWTPITWMVERYGWGYALRVLQFALAYVCF